MAARYTCKSQVVEQVLKSLKERGMVAPDACFASEAPGNLRREVAYRDYDFLLTLSRTDGAEIVADVLAWLRDRDLVPEGAAYDEGAFEALWDEVRANFVIPGTSISPLMARLLYMLAAVKKPKRMIGIGTYCGYALVWSAGPSCGPAPAYRAERITGIDIDPEATASARANLATLANTGHVELLAEDGLQAVERLAGPFDYVFLDAESKEMGKGIYLPLLERLYDKIEKGGWVLAHDTTVPPFGRQFGPYLDFVRNPDTFWQSLSLDVDPFGLELSVK